MDRRQFLKSIALQVGTYGLLATELGTLGCTDSKPKEIVTSNSSYQIKDGVLTQSIQDKEHISIGIFADIHGNRKNSQFFADKINDISDIFFLAGDLLNSRLRDSVSGYEEIIKSVEPIAQKNKLVLVIPGNHEKKIDYKNALEDLTSHYANVVDMNTIPVADLDSLTIVGLGGNANQMFCVRNGYLRTKEDFFELGELVKKYQTDKPLLVATHMPKLYETSKGLDVIDSGINVGGHYLAEVRNALNSKFAVSGHIHEAFGLIDSNERTVKQGEYSDSLDFNPGAVYDHYKKPRFEEHKKVLKPAAGVMEFKNNKARAYIVNK
jgi:Icc-related predicted phosphoesterase